MRPPDPGLLPSSQIYLHDASERARGMYLYALCAGRYDCEPSYVVRRASFDSHLLLYVRRGTAYYVDDRARRVTLGRNAFALIDCYSPHEYGAAGPCELYWVHFDGPTARALCDTIRSLESPVPRNLDHCSRTLMELVERSAGPSALEEAVVNRMLVTILTEFLVRAEQRSVVGNAGIEAVRSYILENPDKPLTLEDLARRANLSPYHFARTFKRQVGVSPHDYLIHARLNLAKFYLLSTNDSIKQIAFNCGFSSEGGFCTTFRKRLGVTPTAFRAGR